MKLFEVTGRTGTVAGTITALALAAFAVSTGPYGKAQQQESGQIRQGSPAKGSPQPGGSATPTGGTVIGPGAGAQAVAADPQHGGQAAPPARAGLVAYPDRPLAPKEVLDRGKAVYSVNCAFCHGSDAGGGSIGPNLLRSEVVLQDKNGEMILPIVHGARMAQGMPRIDIADSSVPDIAAWLHSLKTGGNMRSTEKINIVVGNAATGKGTYEQLCSSCHAPSTMQGFAAKFPDARSMQQAWLLPGGGGGFQRPGTPAGPVLKVPPATATVTPASGAPVTGRLGTIDDFYVEVTTDDGTTHRYSRDGAVPKVEIHDPLAPHRALFRKYNDAQIHDITAYLETLK
ncbi:MAG: c-type cytochrome [Janthinobacterium lividum]